MPSNWLVFDRIRALARQGRIYGFERVFQDQPNLDRLTAGGEFLDFNNQAAILDQTNLQINRLERYRDYEQMDQTGEISLALDLYADEASLVDPERKHTIIIRARNRRLKRELEDLFFNTLQWDTYCRPSVRYLCKYGDLPYEVILDQHRSAVASLKFMNVYNFTRIETRYGDLIGFFYMDALWPRPQFLHPWQVMHLRLTSFENIYHPYGRCSDMRSKILVPGGHKELRDLSAGDVVYSFNGITPEPTRVVNTVCSGYKPSVLIRTKYRELKVSEDHPILAVMGGADGRPFKRYVPAKHVVPGSQIVVHDPEFDDDNSYMTEEVLKRREIGRLEVGDIQVESPYHNFNANGVVIHNSILDGGRKAFKQLRLMEDAALIYRICLRGDTLVWTPTGHTPIKDLKIGDEVYCFKDGAPKVTKVVDWQCNGKDVIYRIKSQHREICANATHPILVEVSYANKCDHDRPVRLEYVDVKDLIVKRNGIAKHHRFILPQIEHGQYVDLNHSAVEESGSSGVTTKVIKRVFSIPKVATEEFAKWFGFMIGDGFVSARPHINQPSSITRQVGFAAGDDAYTNDYYAQLFRTLVGSVTFSGDSGHRLGAYSINSKPLYYFMLDNGFIPGAANKRIPAWVFQSPRSVQEAFIDGYIDADGHRRICDGGKTESCEVDCCNEMLLRDLKELCHRLGWNVGLVRKHERIGGHAIEPGRIIPNTTAWALYFTKTQLPDPEYVVKAGERCSNASEAILEVEEIEEDLVYDITVEDDCHNFISNGNVQANTRAPEKRKFTIPVGLIPPKEVPEYMQMIARNFKRQRFYNPSTGSFDERYSPLIQEDDFFLPRRPDGTGPDVDVLPGGENVDKIADIEYFKKKMIAPTKIPFARVGIGEGSGEANEKSLSQSHSEFAKAVQWVQREVATGLTKVAIIHLALRGYSVEDLKGFDIALTATSAMEELYRIETWQTRVGVMADLKELGWFPKEWIVTNFTDLSPDEIEELKEMSVEATSGGGGGGGGGGGLDIPGGDPSVDDPSMDPSAVDPSTDPAAAGAEAAAMTDPSSMGVESKLPGVDWEADKRLLLEYKRQGQMGKAMKLVRRWADRLGKPQYAEQREFTNGFQGILENKELDGLCGGKPRSKVVVAEGLEPALTYDPNVDPGNMVSWSVPKAVRDEVIKEVYDVITVGQVAPNVVDSDEITESDLPITVSNL